MVGLVGKLVSLTGWATLKAAAGGGVGYLAGFIYAKLADLPAAETAKVNAVAHAAMTAITSVIKNLSEGKKNANYINGAVKVLLGAGYIYELRRRGFMGNKLLIIYTIGIAFSVWDDVYRQGGTKKVADPLLPVLPVDKKTVP